MKEIVGNMKCHRCGKVIANIVKTEPYGRAHEENTAERFIDKWGGARNYCIDCMKIYSRKGTAYKG